MTDPLSILTAAVIAAFAICLICCSIAPVLCPDDSDQEPRRRVH